MKNINKQDLLKSKVFCVIPWISTHVWPNGDVYPCCAAPSNAPFGSVATTDLMDIWNNDNYKNMRSSILNDNSVSSCQVCYKVEKYGSISIRTGLNSKFIDTAIPLIEQTQEDGTLPVMNLTYWDYRFSNLCNLKCRTCGPDLSSSWHADHEKLHNYSRPVKFIKDQILLKNLDIMIDSNLDKVEEIYFAGGEPLMMAEHHKIITKLIESGRAGSVRLRYSTNLTTLKFKGMHFPDIWPLFKEVIVGISLDEVGDRAEYWRSGTNWETLKQNLITLSEVSKVHHTVTMPFYPVLCIFNMHRMFEIVSELNAMGVLHGCNHIWFNTLNDPSFYRYEIAPVELRIMCGENLNKLKDLLTRLVDTQQISNFPFDEIINGAIQRLNDADIVPNKEIQQFVETTNKLDAIREEKFQDVAPELFKILMASEYRDN